MDSDRYPLILFVVIKISDMMVVQQAWEECDQDQSRHSNFNNSNFVSDSNSNNSRRLSTILFEILQKVKSIMNRFIIRGSHEFMQ